MGIQYRSATPADCALVACLLHDYMHETYSSTWHGSASKLNRDGFGAHFNMTVADVAQEIVGFVAWRSTYDLHHCMPGMEVIDMFVGPGDRGRGIAACLLACVAAQGAGAGATFMTGGAVDRGSARRLYGRSTMSYGGQAYLSGRAFRAFAELAGASPRQLIKSLPPREWNLLP